MAIWAQCTGLNVNTSSTAEEAVISGDLSVSSDIFTEDLNVDDVFDNGQGYIYMLDDVYIQNGELLRADSNNLNIEGGGDPVIIGSGSVGGATDDLEVLGDLNVTGTKNCVVHAKDNHSYIYSVIESSEVWLEEKLRGKLSNGKKEVKLDPRFIASTVIDDKHPIHCQVTNTSDCNGLWIEKFFDKVIVHGTGNSSFDLTISAKRFGLEDHKFDEYLLDKDLEINYKKSKEKLFKAQKRLRIEVNRLSKEIKEDKEGFKEEHQKVKELDDEFREALKKEDKQKVEEIKKKVKIERFKQKELQTSMKEKGKELQEKNKLIRELQDKFKAGQDL